MSTNSTTAAARPVDLARAAESRGYEVTIANIVCAVFALVLVVLRVYTRLVVVRKRFWEDFAIVMAMICSIVMSVLNQLAVVYGTGRHTDTISKEDYVEFQKIGVGVSQLYSFCHFFLKLSILLQFNRISVLPFERRLFQGVIAINCLGYAIFIVLRGVRCLPVEAQWVAVEKIPGARCLFPSTWFIFASQVWNLVMDLVILVGPLVVLRHSNAPVLQRVLIGIVLGFGAAACIISIIRMETLLPTTAHSKDPLWDKVPTVIYAIIEINLGIACAAVVTLRPLYRRVRDAFHGRGVNNGGRHVPHASTGYYLNSPDQWRPGPSPRLGSNVSIDLISGERVHASSSSGHDDDKIELGEAVHVAPLPDRAAPGAHAATP